MQIIGFGHKSRVGKDTIAGYLFTNIKLKYPKKKVRKVGYADLLKEIAWKLYAWDGMQSKDHYDRNPDARYVKLPTVGKTPVEIWIELGMKVREIYPDSWLFVAMRGFEVDVLIITDVRFPNEAESVTQEGGWLYLVDRPGYDGISDSDRALDNCVVPHERILNDGDHNKLHDEALKILARLEEQWQSKQA